jgi:hypothetical protein
LWLTLIVWSTVKGNRDNTDDDDDSQGKSSARRRCHPQRLTEGLLLVAGAGIVMTLLLLAAPWLERAIEGDPFAAYRALSKASTHAVELGKPLFDCDTLATLRDTLHVADELWSDGLFRVVQFRVPHVATRTFAFKLVHDTPTRAVNGTKVRPALPDHLKRAVHFLSEAEHLELMERYDAERARLADANTPSAPDADAAVDGRDSAAAARHLSFGRRSSKKHPSKKAQAFADVGEPPGARHLLAAAPERAARSSFDVASVRKTALEALILEARYMQHVAADAHPNLMHYRGGCHEADEDGTNVIGSVFELGPFTRQHEPMLRFLQSDAVPWCAKLHVAIQLLFTIEHLSRPGPLRLCSLLPAHFTVSDDGQLLLHNIDEVMGPDVERAHDRHSRVTGELHCDAGVKFGRPADEPASGAHVSAFLGGAVLRMIARRSDDLKPFLSLVASKLLVKDFLHRMHVDAAIEELVTEFHSAGGTACHAEWRAELDAKRDADGGDDGDLDRDESDSESEGTDEQLAEAEP